MAQPCPRTQVDAQEDAQWSNPSNLSTQPNMTNPCTRAQWDAQEDAQWSAAPTQATLAQPRQKDAQSGCVVVC
jgi:hypothetical protein